MSFSCLSLGDSLYQNGSGELEVQLATGSGLEIIAGEGLSLESDQLSPIWQNWSTFAWAAGITGGTVNDARYVQNGKTIHFYFKWTSTAGASVTATPQFDLPVPARTGVWGADSAFPGNGGYYFPGSQTYTGHMKHTSTVDRVALYLDAADSTRVYNGGTNAYVTSTVPLTWSSYTTAVIHFAGWYEAQ